MANLYADLARQKVTFVIIDFEATTPAGRPAQPIEVAVRALRYQDGAWARVGQSTTLIKPPAFAPVTAANTAQSGLSPEHFRQAPTPAEALGALDRKFAVGRPYLLVAQHAATEANIIHNQREHCPRLARINFLDTIPLAKHLIPDLASYKLDALLRHFSIAHPADRHRAYADVNVTAEVFLHLIDAAQASGHLHDLAALVKIAGRTAKCNRPTQEGLFDL